MLQTIKYSSGIILIGSVLAGDNNRSQSTQLINHDPIWIIALVRVLTNYERGPST